MDARATSILDRFEGHLRSQRAGNLGCLALPGREPAEVRSVLDDLADHVPDELVAWFSWQDGVAEPDGAHPQRMTIIGMWVPYSLDEAVTYVREGPQWAGYPRDGTSWLPLVHGPIGAGQGMRMLIASWSDSQRARIVTGGWGEPEISGVAPSLTDLVSGWLAAFEAGMRWDPSMENWSVSDVRHPRRDDWVRARLG